MTPERWQQIDRLLEQTLEEEPEERADFLDNACADDSELRREVEALLTAHQQAGSFIEVPARVAATAGLAEPLTQSIQGRQLGPYTISSLLGAGGMGEVYLARDTRLDRPVALKMLPPGMTSDPERLRRFVREAKAASTLNHPNIATIYEIGKSNHLMKQTRPLPQTANGSTSTRIVMEFHRYGRCRPRAEPWYR